MKKKRHHHYVWRYYLRAWASHEKITCLREGKIFESNLMGVAQQKDFYKLKELDLEDIVSIKKLVIDNTPREHLRKLHEEWLKNFNVIFQIKEVIKSKGILDEKLNSMLDTAIYNLEEDLHADIENVAIKYINSILKGDIEFYYTDKGCMEFMYFLCVQHQRTEKIKKSVLESVKHIEIIDFEKIWNILSHMFATNMAWVFYAERKIFKMILLKNGSRKEFITGDQPVINTYSDIGVSKSPPENVELYYPVSPIFAILISEKEEYKDVKQKTLSEEEVVLYNKLIVKNSYNQIYATSKDVLEEYNNVKDKSY